LCSACAPPADTTTWPGVTSKPLAVLTFSAIAARSASVPALGT
jgi:hypothetical protein